MLYFKQLPQHLLALLLILLFRMNKITTIGHTSIYTGNFLWGVSLGDYVLIGKLVLNPVTICHEIGHTKQSYKWGWLYLLVIGLPSAIQNILTSFNILKRENYYRRFPEKQADKLGGVIVENNIRTILDEKKRLYEAFC